MSMRHSKFFGRAKWMTSHARFQYSWPICIFLLPIEVGQARRVCPVGKARTSADRGSPFVLRRRHPAPAVGGLEGMPKRQGGGELCWGARRARFHYSPRAQVVGP
jgi:hypothetical protein